MSAASEAAAFDDLADDMAIAAGQLDPPMVRADIPNHHGGRLDDKRDSGLIWCGLLALICGTPDFRLAKSQEFWATHRDAALAAGAVASAVCRTRDWCRVADVMAETALVPWIARLTCRRPPGNRWGAFDGRCILVSGPQIADPPPLAEWDAGHAVAVPDIEAARNDLATVGRLDGEAGR